MAPWSRKREPPPAPPKKVTTIWREKLERSKRPVVLDDTPRKPRELTPEEKEWLKKAEGSAIGKFLLRSQERTRQENEEAIKKNSRPFRREDAALWKKLPLVPGLNGLPLPRKAIQSEGEAKDKFFAFIKQFHFGLWGYRQHPYPPEKPWDVQQTLGSKWLNRRYYDHAMRGGNFYYKDRLGRTRGPMEVVNLKTAYAAGIVDKNTFVWGDDMDEWAPLGMVYGLHSAVAAPDARLAAWGGAIVHKVARGMNPFRARKGHRRVSYAELQRMALDKREREEAVLANHGGAWPGERVPSHALFLWAGGSQLTDLLESNKVMPDKFIPAHVRRKLMEQIPGLRPHEIVKWEQWADLLMYNREWWREPLGAFKLRPQYLIVNDAEILERQQQEAAQGLEPGAGELDEVGGGGGVSRYDDADDI